MSKYLQSQINSKLQLLETNKKREREQDNKRQKDFDDSVKMDEIKQKQKRASMA